MTVDLKTTRQARLAEVGAFGQARLASAHVLVAEEEPVLERYLRGAGLQTEASSDVPRDDPPAWIASLSPAALDVAAGAHGALIVVRAVLAGSPHRRVPAHRADA